MVERLIVSPGGLGNEVKSPGREVWSDDLEGIPYCRNRNWGSGRIRSANGVEQGPSLWAPVHASEAAQRRNLSLMRLG